MADKEKIHFGWQGKILLIDLKQKKTETLELPLEIYRKFIGGRGLAGYFLTFQVTRSWNDPDMPVILMTGPMVNTASPTSGRMAIMSRSPLTGTIGDASVGGTLGRSIKKAGWDGIIITGKSDCLCGIDINDQQIIFRNAISLKGKGADTVHKKIKSRGATVIIGPAAENGVLFANIIVDGHYFAGRNGLGLCLSAKGIKYITVSGSQTTLIHDQSEMIKAREDILRLTSASPILQGELGIAHYGTGALYDLIDSRHLMPTDNFSKTYFPHSAKTNAYAYEHKYHPSQKGCWGCHIQCKRVTAEGKSIPEFETMSHFSALLNNDDIDTVFRANQVCNQMGMDTISAAATLATYAQIKGKSLKPKEIISLLKNIAISKGDGQELAQGSFRYAQSKGVPEATVTVKKQELPAYDPRGAYGMALAYATSTRGGCHLRAYPISHEILRKPVITDRFSFAGKARIIKIAEDLMAVIDSLTACKFIFFAATLEEYARIFTAVTGISSTAQDLIQVGERIVYHERMMNARNGFDIKDDTLPEIFFQRPGTPLNNIRVNPINRDEFQKTRESYYQIRGLTKTGLPQKTKAGQLGLEWND